MVHSGPTLAFGFLALALFASCGGRASHDAVDGVGASGNSSSWGGNGAASNSPDAGVERGGVPGAAGQGGSHAGRGGTGGTAAAGSPNTGGGQVGGATSGSGGVPAAGGESGDGGADGSLLEAVTASCSSLCEELAPCATFGGLGSSCQADCESTLTARNGECMELGLAMSSCIKGASASVDDCVEKFYRPPQGACFNAVTAFQDCVSGTSGAQLPPMLCAQVSFSASDCVEDRKCLNSTWYNLRCVPTEDGQSECTCKVTGDYTEDITLTETVSLPAADACKERITACLASSSLEP